MWMTHLTAGAEAMDEPFVAFPSWMHAHQMRPAAGKDRFLVETHFDKPDNAAPRYHQEHAPRWLRRTGW